MADRVGQWIVNLPRVNGEIEAGITVGVDPALPDEQKLPIFHIAHAIDFNVCKENALLWAAGRMNNLVARALLVNGVAVLFDTGRIAGTVAGYTAPEAQGVPAGYGSLVERTRYVEDINAEREEIGAAPFVGLYPPRCYRNIPRNTPIKNIVPDGDWRYTDSSDYEIEAGANLAPEVLQRRTVRRKILHDSINADALKRALVVILATKANWWAMNHHTGQGAVQGYERKVLHVFYGDNVNEDLVTAAHTLGHFASTRKVLTTAGLQGISPTICPLGAAHNEIVLSNDARLRFQSLPAGTHRLAVSYTAAKKLVNSVVARICPGVKDFADLPG